MTHTVDRMMGLFRFFFESDSLNRKKGVLRAAIAFFADAGLFAPQVAVNGVTLRQFVVAVALRETHPAAVGKFTQKA